MNGTWLAVATVIAALGSALVAGFFFAFSIVVMKALGRLAAEHGIAAMRSINVVVLNAWFFTAFFGTGVLCVFLAAWSLIDWSGGRSVYLLAGSSLYPYLCHRGHDRPQRAAEQYPRHCPGRW